MKAQLSTSQVYQEEINECLRRKNDLPSTNYSILINNIKPILNKRKQQTKLKKNKLSTLKKIFWMDSEFYVVKR